MAYITGFLTQHCKSCSKLILGNHPSIADTNFSNDTQFYSILYKVEILISSDMIQVYIH